MIVITMLT